MMDSFQKQTGIKFMKTMSLIYYQTDILKVTHKKSTQLQVILLLVILLNIIIDNNKYSQKM